MFMTLQFRKNLQDVRTQDSITSSKPNPRRVMVLGLLAQNCFPLVFLLERAREQAGMVDREWVPIRSNGGNQRFEGDKPVLELAAVFRYTLWLFNIAMENGPFIDGLPIM